MTSLWSTREFYIYILQAKIEVMIWYNVGFTYYPLVPILNPPQHPKKTNCKVESHGLLYMHSITTPNRLQKALLTGGRSLAISAIPLVCFYHLFVGKSKLGIWVDNEMRDMHHQYMGFWLSKYPLLPRRSTACLGLSMSPNIPLCDNNGALA